MKCDECDRMAEYVHAEFCACSKHSCMECVPRKQTLQYYEEKYKQASIDRSKHDYGAQIDAERDAFRDLMWAKKCFG